VPGRAPFLTDGDPAVPAPIGRPRSPATVLIVVLPVLLLVAAVVLGVISWQRTSAPAPAADRPVALAPLDAPDAGSPSCQRLLGALPAQLDSSSGPLHRAQLAAPAPAGASAWTGAGAPQPVMLRCGLPRPAELRPTSELIVIDQVSWLVLASSEADSFIAVDRPVYIALTVPRGLGTGPVQTVSDTITSAASALPKTGPGSEPKVGR
jgi:uncharacterized protein DUF3515